jgi:hypothetical protein
LNDARYEKLRSANVLVRIDESGTPRQPDSPTSGVELSASSSVRRGVAGKEEPNGLPERGVNGSATIAALAAQLDSLDRQSSAAIRGSDIPASQFSVQMRIAGGIVALLSAVLLGVLFRAARRRS